MYQIMTGTEFNQKLAKAGHSQMETNKLFDELIYDALHQAAPASEGGHGSCQRLTAIVGMAEHTRGINVRKIQAYIQNFADVRWSKNDNGTHSFSFRNKPAVTIPTVSWYDWNHASDKAKPDVDIVKEIKRVLRKAHAEGAHVKDEKGLLSQLTTLAIESGIQYDTGKKSPAAGKHTKHKASA